MQIQKKTHLHKQIYTDLHQKNIYAFLFQGEDLEKLMLTLEHWGHRLFPKMPFDEFLQRVETLGKKKPVQVMS